MHRDALLTLDKPALVELGLELQRANAILTARVAELGGRGAGLGSPAKAPGNSSGPPAEAVLAYLHETQYVSYERLVELCRDVLGLHLSEGAIANVLGRVATRAGPTVERIRDEVRASPVINSDETGARVDGDNRTHWVFQTPTASYHVVATTKGAAVIAELLGDRRPEGWGSDCAPAQLGAAAAPHQLCLAHPIRAPTYADGADGE